MNDQRWERYAAWSGVVFFVLIVIALAISLGTSPPDFDAPADDVARYYADHDGALRASVALASAAFFFFVWFIGTMRAALALAEGSGRRLANLFYGTGLVITACVVLAQGAVAIAALHPDLLSPEVIRALHDFSVVGFAPAAGVFVAFFLAAGLASLRLGMLPGWFGGFSIAAGLIQILGIGPVFTDDGVFAPDGVLGGFLPLVVFILWVPIASVLLARAEVRAAPSP